MSAVKHTPVPWWATDHGVRDGGGYIAHMNSVQHYEGQDERYAFEVAQREADKRLIAAAPCLLKALQSLIPQSMTGNPTHAAQVEFWTSEKLAGRGVADDVLFALDAIARATGQQPDPTR